jgi:hypothetical protein
LYSAQQESAVQGAVANAQNNGTQAQASALPALGMFAMLALAAGVGASLYKRTARRVHVAVPRDDESGLLDGPTE